LVVLLGIEGFCVTDIDCVGDVELLFLLRSRTGGGCIDIRVNFFVSPGTSGTSKTGRISTAPFVAGGGVSQKWLFSHMSAILRPLVLPGATRRLRIDVVYGTLRVSAPWGFVSRGSATGRAA
jgi:hypothetical protein